MDKLLTVVVPSYNMEKFIPTTIGGVLVADEKLRSRLDVIVVNDGSTDRTSEIAHEFERRYPGVVRVIDKPNGHYGSCVNEGLLEARGKFIKILDADDSFLTDGFEKLLIHLKKFDDKTVAETPDLIVSNHRTVNGKGEATGDVVYSLPENCLFDVSYLAPINNGLSHYATTYRTELLRQIGYRQTTGISYTDIEWLFLPMIFADRISFCPAVVYQYLFGRDGQSVSQYKSNTWMVIKVIDRVLNAYEAQHKEMQLERKEYLQQVVFHIANTLYFNYFFVCQMSPLNTELLRIDTRLREAMPKAWSRLGDAVIPRRGKLKFRYVCHWRQHRRVSLPYAWVLRFYIRHAATIGAILNKLSGR